MSVEDDVRRLTRSMIRHPYLVRAKLLRSTAKAPQYMTAGAAGADVFADLGGLVDTDDTPLSLAYALNEQPLQGVSSSWIDGKCQSVSLYRGSTYRIPLGFSLEVPNGWVGVLKGRSGLASEGTEGHLAFIDSDYRGEVCMLLHVEKGMTVKQGDRIGQIAFMPAPQFEIVVVDELSETARGAGGFGSSGMR